MINVTVLYCNIADHDGNALKSAAKLFSSHLILRQFRGDNMTWIR
jgi:hypothetical protein